jgi:hypothetical protein
MSGGGSVRTCLCGQAHPPSIPNGLFGRDKELKEGGSWSRNDD